MKHEFRNPWALATKISHSICSSDCGEKVGKVISTRKASGQTQTEKALISEREETLCRLPKNQTSRGTFVTGGEFLPSALMEQIPFSFFFGPGFLPDFVQGVFSLFRRWIHNLSFHGFLMKTFTDINGLNDATQHNFQCEKTKQMFVI